ncbi:TetR/AcrR family transcriptional regulator [Pseudaeromonas sharmana]|uniref:TetR/AcrR family transcriptional regulator n=1 Tax=Pseudaeromonas sharmana TaxID=328412 RepID=A0ABV8CLW4_9GAMM
MKTKDKIIHAAIELFNLQGEQNVTTNHIAAHLGMSPGNLYYHFRNKEDIIQAIFDRYAEQLNLLFGLDDNSGSESVGGLRTSMRYMEAVVGLMWQFRFIYENLPDILSRDVVMAEKYRQIQEPVYGLMTRHLLGLRAQGILLANDEDLDALLHLMKQVLIFWPAYLHTLTPGGNITKAMVYGVVPRVFFMFRPYMAPEALDELRQLEQYFQDKASQSRVKEGVDA